MRTTKARVLAASILMMGMLVLSIVGPMENASAASLSGTWVSRVSGSGCTQTYMGPGGGMITDHIDISMTLSQSGTGVTGTLRSDQNGVAKSFSVEGTFDGTTFLMTAHYGWDGVSMLNPLYTLTVSGDRMSGSGSYLNVGVTIQSSLDLKKSGSLGGGSLGTGLGDVAPIVSAGVITMAIIAIVIAGTSTVRVPKGFRPQTPAAQPHEFNYEPSIQTTTEVPNQPTSNDGATYLGGAGLQFATPAPAGKPFPPREHYTKVSQEPPRCPIHNGIALQPHFSGPEDQGSWFCPYCKNYPWGKN